MYIRINPDSALSLEEVDDIASFAIVNDAKNIDLNTLDSFSQAAEDDHYWIDIDAVIGLSAKSADALWIDSFWKMLRSVEPYGYADMASKRIKAHIRK
jgi:hypothetical protein